MKTIRISDSGTTTVYHLAGHELAQIVSGGCNNALAGIDLDESMDDSAIGEAVLAAWLVGYYGGDEAARENGLSVYVDDLCEASM